MKNTSGDAFYILKDLAAQIEFSINLKTKKLKLKGKVNEIDISANLGMMKLLMNIGDAFTLDNNILQVMKIDKDSIMKSSKKIDLFYCLESQSSSWKQYYVVFSESYLYFYETECQKIPSMSFFLANTTLKKESVEEDLYVLSVSFILHKIVE